jgi:kynurenine formamidase
MTLPSYADLPIHPDLPAGSSWGVWGADDTFGCLNNLSSEGARRGAACVRSGSVFPLNLELELPDPPLFGRPAHRHEVVQRPSGVSADDMLHGLNTQASSQWDGFRHVRHPIHGAYNGLPEEQHGVHFWAQRGIVGRGVLADVARWRESVGRPIAAGTRDEILASDLHETLRAQGISVERGDILLVRTGWLSWYRTLNADARAAYAVDPRAVGFAAVEATAAALWDLHIACIGVDNPAVEAWPPPMYSLSVEERAEAMAATGDPALAAQTFLHLNLLPLLGLPLGELFDLDRLGEHCFATRTYDFMVTSAPLNLRNGVATPPNVIAVC